MEAERQFAGLIVLDIALDEAHRRAGALNSVLDEKDSKMWDQLTAEVAAMKRTGSMVVLDIEDD